MSRSCLPGVIPDRRSSRARSAPWPQPATALSARPRKRRRLRRRTHGFLPRGRLELQLQTNLASCSRLLGRCCRGWWGWWRRGRRDARPARSEPVGKTVAQAISNFLRKAKRCKQAAQNEDEVKVARFGRRLHGRRRRLRRHHRPRRALHRAQPWRRLLRRALRGPWGWGWDGGGLGVGAWSRLGGRHLQRGPAHRQTHPINLWPPPGIDE